MQERREPAPTKGTPESESTVTTRKITNIPENLKGIFNLREGNLLEITEPGSQKRAFFSGGPDVGINYDDLRKLLGEKCQLKLSFGVNVSKEDAGKARFIDGQESPDKPSPALTVGEALARFKETLGRENTTQAETAEETAWLMSLTDKSKGKESQEAEIVKFRVNLQGLKYSFGKTSDGKRVTVYDEAGVTVGNPDLIYLFPQEKKWGWKSLAGANEFLESEIEKGEPKRKQEKAERDAKVQRLIASCEKLGYTFKYGSNYNSFWGTSPLIMFLDENGQNPVIDSDFGEKNCGRTSIDFANEFLEEELKLSKEERHKQKAEAKAKIKAEADKFQSYLQILGCTSEMSANALGNSLLMIYHKDGKSISINEYGKNQGFLSYAAANEFLEKEQRKLATTAPIQPPSEEGKKEPTREEQIEEEVKKIRQERLNNPRELEYSNKWLKYLGITPGTPEADRVRVALDRHNAEYAIKQREIHEEWKRREGAGETITIDELQHEKGFDKWHTKHNQEWTKYIRNKGWLNEAK